MSEYAIDIADPLARTLAERQIDPNEFAKSFTQLRVALEPQRGNEQAQAQAVEEWWRWLELVAGPGSRAVIRSNRTRDYYVAILDACRHHLEHLEPELLLPTVGWAVRLLRYYQNVPDALDTPSPFAPASSVPAKPQVPPKAATPAVQPAKPQLPEPGQRINNVRVDEVTPGGVFVALGLPEELQAIGAIRNQDLGGKRYSRGNQLNVEVIEIRRRDDGSAILFLRPVSGQAKK
ncbi:MAG: hypothetical protein H0X37_23320 [Herpetosiphonaceae bacterium]|nr:hypothetical protein [Herpetosiphonaceae bacterium]